MAGVKITLQEDPSPKPATADFAFNTKQVVLVTANTPARAGFWAGSGIGFGAG